MNIPAMFWISVALALGCYCVWSLIRPLLVRRRLRILLSEFESAITDDDTHRAMRRAVQNDMYQCIRVVSKLNRPVLDAQRKTISELFFPGIDTEDEAIVQAYDRLKKDVEKFIYKYVDRWRLSGVLIWLLGARDKTSDTHTQRAYRAKLACASGLGLVVVLLCISLALAVLDDPKASGVPVVEHPRASAGIVVSRADWLLTYAEEAFNEHGLDYEQARVEHRRVLDFFIRITERHALLSDCHGFCDSLQTLKHARWVLSERDIDAKTSIAKVAEFIGSFESCMRLAEAAANYGYGIKLEADEAEEVNSVLEEFHEMADRLIEAAKDLQNDPVTNDNARRFFDLGQWSCLKSRTATLYLIAVFPEFYESNHTAAFRLKQREMVKAITKIDEQMKDINKLYSKKLREYAQSIQKRTSMLEKLETGDFSTVCESLRRSVDKSLFEALGLELD